MKILDFLNRNAEKVPTYADSGLQYSIEKVGSLQLPDKICDSNAFELSKNVAELFFCIDFLADRGSKLRFYIADKTGAEVEKSEYNRFLTAPNPFYSFSELFYQSIFSLLADGNLFHYVGSPSIYREATANNISRIDVLDPSLVSIREVKGLSILNATSAKDFISQLKLNNEVLDVDRLSIYRYDSTVRGGSRILARSPLFNAERNINNLLATYSARYNVYVNNGAAGYLSKKSGQNGVDTIGTNRDEILKDLNDKHGITGNRRLWGISSTPLEFINTLIDIQKLMPYEETLENTIKIASTFQIPANLVPRKDQSTFNNQAEAERSIWENTLTSLVNTVTDYFTRSLKLNKAGYSIKADYSSVSALVDNESAEEDVKAKQLANLKTAIELGAKIDIQKEIEKIYGKEND